MENANPSRALNASVLVLNRYYVAVHIVTVRRAFILLYRDLAEVVQIESGHYSTYDFDSWLALSEMRVADRESHEDWVRAVSFEVEVPRIVRLTEYDRLPRQSLRFNRRNLFARDNHCCQYCGGVFPTSQLSIDHVVPRSRGGETSWENAVCSCLTCNTRKGGRTPQEARMDLLKTPSRPTHNPLLAMKLSNPKYSSWRTFLPNASWAVEVR